MAIQSREPHCALVPKGDGQGMLQMSAPSHGGITVRNGKTLQGGNYSRKFRIDNFKPGLDLQDTGRVHDVLRRGAPVDVLASRTTHGAELAHQGQDWVSYNIGLVTKTVEVESRNIGLRCDLVTGVGGDDTAMSLRPREGRLDVNTSSDVCLVAKDLVKSADGNYKDKIDSHVANLLCAKQVAEDDGVKGADGAQTATLGLRWEPDRRSQTTAGYKGSQHDFNSTGSQLNSLH